MVSTKDILPLTLNNLGVKRQFAIQTIILHWRDIVGNDISLQSRPTSAKNGVLFVAVKTPVWGHHLSMLKEQLLVKIHEHLGQKLLADIKFYAGNFSDYANSIEDEPNFGVKLRSVTLSNAQCMEVKEIAHAVNDSHLRYRLQRMMIKDKKRRSLLLQEGWHQCLTCSALCPTEEKYCTSCAIDNSRRRREEIRRLLADAPWVGYIETNSCVPCTRTEYIRSKQELIQSLLYTIDANNPNTINISTLAMLLFRIMPDNLDPESIEKTLRFIRRNRYVFTSRR
jgi:hypothetical protein